MPVVHTRKIRSRVGRAAKFFTTRALPTRYARRHRNIRGPSAGRSSLGVRQRHAKDRRLTETLEQVPLKHGKFRGQAENMDITGTIDLTPDGKSTKITYTMAVQAKGPLARIMDNFMRTRLKAQTEEFATNLKKSIEG